MLVWPPALVMSRAVPVLVVPLLDWNSVTPPELLMIVALPESESMIFRLPPLTLVIVALPGEELRNRVTAALPLLVMVALPAVEPPRKDTVELPLFTTFALAAVVPAPLNTRLPGVGVLLGAATMSVGALAELLMMPAPVKVIGNVPRLKV